MALKYEPDFQPSIDSLNFGETIRINHTNCTAGEDTRGRLYISKPATGGGEVLAYCHNCQEGNRWHSGESFRISTEIESSPKIRPLNIYDYDCFDHNTWPADAKKELYQYGIGDKSAYFSDIRYDPSTHRLVFPVYDEIFFYDVTSSVGTLKGIQKKRLIGSGTKYITEMNNDEVDLSCILIHWPHERDLCTGVIVEDFLSGVRIIQWAKGKHNVKVLVNYGTKVNPEAIKNMTGLEKLVVWLDNDSDHVREQAKTMATVARLIQPQGVVIQIEEDRVDPKKEGYGTIEGVLRG